MDHGASCYRRYLDGDESAFRQIVKEYFEPLAFFVNRYVNDYAAAEDIALDAFTQLVVHKHRYNFSVSLKTYLFMIGRSRALDYIRHRDRLQLVELSQAAQLASQEPSPEELVLVDERSRAVNAAMTQLAEELRLVLHLVYFEGLTPDEVSKVLKKSRKQIYNLLYRGKTALRSILGKEGEKLL